MLKLICGLTALILAGCATPPPAPAAHRSTGLEGTRWEFAVFSSMDDAQPPLRPADPTRYALDFAVDGRLMLRLDCNSGRTTWQAVPAPDSGLARRSGSLSFGPIATTRMACPPGSLEPRLTAVLPYVRSFVIEHGQLHLALQADGGILSWNHAPPTATPR